MGRERKKKQNKKGGYEITVFWLARENGHGRSERDHKSHQHRLEQEELEFPYFPQLGTLVLPSLFFLCLCLCLCVCVCEGMKKSACKSGPRSGHDDHLIWTHLRPAQLDDG